MKLKTRTHISHFKSFKKKVLKISALLSSKLNQANGCEGIQTQ